MNDFGIQRRRAAWFLLTAIVAYSTISQAAAIEVEAYSGAPFGVGRVTFGVRSEGPVVPLEDERFTVESAEGRVLYPVIAEQPARRLIRQLLEIDSPLSVTMYFLFRGDEPFQLKAFSPSLQTVQVSPRVNPQAHRALLDGWWGAYGNRWKNLRQDPQFPPVAENFLAANMARRLGLTLPEPSAGLFAALAPKKTVWDELFVTESHQLEIDQALLTAVQPGEQVKQPLPPPMPWYELSMTEDLSGVAVEPLAAHVPVEAFYVRFGNFTNYLWFRNLSRQWQGDLGNMIVRRGIDRASTKRVEQQLSLQESVLAQFVGPQVIEDVAIIGLDPYLNYGGAVGILFQAKNTPVLTQDLTRQRRTALAKFPKAKESTVRIADREVSLIATPSGEVRSYYATDGDFHLVTTSKRLAERFIQAGQGERSLASSVGFRSMRQRLPVERPEAAFVYISPEFIRELTSPAIWIEAQRRARSVREEKIIQLALRQAAAEGVPAANMVELMKAGLLDTTFAARTDGSSLVMTVTGPADSLRGNFGFFTPAADMNAPANVISAEAAAYRDFSDRFRQQVGQTPPIGVGVSRVPLPDGNGESLSIDVVATPLKDVKLGRLPDALGEPSAERTAPVEGDLIHAEFVLDSPLPLGAAAEPHHLFFGIRDFRSPLVAEGGRLAAGAPPSELIRMYLGTWPKPGGLFKLLFGEPTARGPEPVQGGQDTWQARRDEFLLISFKPDVVEQVLPQLQMIPAAEAAQVWIDIAELTGTQLSQTVSALGYARSREASVAACRLMNTLVNQLHVPRENCREVAEQLMDGTFVCPLGGTYELVEVAGGPPMWTSTAVAPQNRFLLTAPPEDFELPLLTWFRGFRAEARLDEEAIVGHLELDMAKSAVP